jgi:DNA topoisomerase-1
MTSDSYETKQLATALFLIDKLALRVGNEKKSNEAETVGVSTLKIKNITILPNDTIKLDFLGKDSIRYVNKFKVPSIVYKNINEFYTHNDKSNNDDLFDMITSETLNKYIKRFMKKLTSKVFRTYNASYLMQIELKKISKKYQDYDKPDKIQKLYHEYEMANLKVAKLCNHQKEVSSLSSSQMEKTEIKIKELKSKINKLNRDKNKKIEKGKKTTSINKRISSIKDKIKNLKNKKSRQKESKSLSTGTSKINYIDPRITIAFLKTNNSINNIDKFFNKSHQKQFAWALEVDSNYRF